MDAFVLTVSREHDGTTDPKNSSVVPGANLDTAIKRGELVENSLNQLEFAAIGIVLIALCALSARSAALAIKVQYVVMAAIALSKLPARPREASTVSGVMPSRLT